MADTPGPLKVTVIEQNELGGSTPVATSDEHFEVRPNGTLLVGRKSPNDTFIPLKAWEMSRWIKVYLEPASS